MSKPARPLEDLFPQAKPVRRFSPFPIRIEHGRVTRTVFPRPPRRPATTLPDAPF